MLTLSALDLDDGILDYPRPKTGLPRRCPLWPETVAEIREVLATRKAPKDEANAGLVFITRSAGFAFNEVVVSLAGASIFSAKIWHASDSRPALNA